MFQPRMLCRRFRKTKHIYSLDLDVYKRQILLSTKSITVLDTFNIYNFLACVLIGVVSLSRHGLTHGAVAGICSGIILGIGGLFPEFVAVLTICGLPVSYTHLDVYKRQAINRAKVDFPAPENPSIITRFIIKIALRTRDRFHRTILNRLYHI